MRQTNSTLTFLAAQYRAVLKDAYLKGLASTAIVGTAVLSTMGTALAGEGDTQVPPTENAATEFTSIDQLANADANLVYSKSGSGAGNSGTILSFDGSKQWNADLTVSSTQKTNHLTFRALQKAQVTGDTASFEGSGSLTVNGTNNPVVIFEHQDGNYEFTTDIENIDIQNGGVWIRSGAGKGRDARVTAKNIVIGQDKSTGQSGSGTVQIVGQHGTKGSGDDGTATLGDSEAKIQFNNGYISFHGHEAANANLEGNIEGKGGILEFRHGNGTVKAQGQTKGTNVEIWAQSGSSNQVKQARTAVFDFNTALDAIEKNEANLTMDSGTITIGGYSGNGTEDITTKAGTMQVKRGVLELGSDIKLMSKDHNGGRLLVGDNSNNQAKIKLSKEQLNSFLNGNSGSATPSPNQPSVTADPVQGKGRVQLTSGGTLYLKPTTTTGADGSVSTTAEPMDLNDLTFANNAADGQIYVSSAGTAIETENLKVDKALSYKSGSTDVTPTHKVNLKAQNITLHEVNESGSDLNFQRAYASDVTFVAASGSTPPSPDTGTGGEQAGQDPDVSPKATDVFNLKNEVQISKRKLANNPYNPSGDQIYVADAGTIEENLSLDSGGKLIIGAGNITAKGNITVRDGDLAIGGSDLNLDKGVDATLNMDGTLEIANVRSGTTINIQGNGAIELPTAEAGVKQAYQSRGKLDLTKAKVKVSGNNANFTTFKATDSTIAVSQEGFDELLNAKNQRTAGSGGAAVSLGNNSNLDIEGDLRKLAANGTGADGSTDANGKSVGFSTDKFKKVAADTDVTTDMIAFTGSGGRVSAQNVHLQGDNLDIGNNTLSVAQSLTLDAPEAVNPAPTPTPSPDGNPDAGAGATPDAGTGTTPDVGTGTTPDVDSDASPINFNINQALAQAQQAMGAAQKVMAATANQDGADSTPDADGQAGGADQNNGQGATPATKSFTIKNGTINVGSQLTATDKSQNIIIGNDGSSSATVNLGLVSGPQDRFSAANGQRHMMAANSPVTGSVDVNVKLNGLNADKQAHLNVADGNWTAKDIDLGAHGVLNVGVPLTAIEPALPGQNPDQGGQGGTGQGDVTGPDASPDQGAGDTNGVAPAYRTDSALAATGPQLTAQKVSLDSGSNINITANAQADFERLDMNGGNIDIKGQMSVGQKTPGASGNNGNQNKDKYAYNVSGGSIKVTGREAKLELGKDTLSDLQFAIKQTKDLLASEWAEDEQFLINNGDPNVPVNPIDPLPIPDTGTDSTTTIDPNNKYTNNIELADAATLKLDFSADQRLTTEDLKNLRKEFIAASSLEGDKIKDGYLDIGQAKIAGIDVNEKGEVSWNDFQDIGDVGGGSLDDVLNEELKGATLVDVPNGSTISGNFGNVRVDNGGTSLNVGDTTLHNASGQGHNNFIANASQPEQALGANVTSGSTFGLYNGGTIGDITLAAGTSDQDKTTLNVVASNGRPTNINSINGGSNTRVNIDGTTVVTKDLTAGELEVNSDLTINGDQTNVKFLSNNGKPGQGSLHAQNLNVTGDSSVTNNKVDYAGNLDIAQKAAFGTDTTLRGNNQFNEVAFDDRAHLASGTTYANNVSIRSGKQLVVGSDRSGSDRGSSATLVARNLALNGGSLVADPEYGQKATIVAVGRMGPQTAKASAVQTAQAANAVHAAAPANAAANAAAPAAAAPAYRHDDSEANHLAAILAQASAQRAQNGTTMPAPTPIAQQNAKALAADSAYDGGVIDGQVVALQNSIVAVGVNTNDINQAIREVEANFAPLMENGSLKDPRNGADNIGAIAYVAKPVKVANGGRIVVDASNNLSGYQNNSNAYQQGDVYLAKKSALAVSQNASMRSDMAAVNIDKADGKVYAEDGAEVLVTGANFNPNSSVKLFADQDGSAELVTEGNSSLTVRTVNNLFRAELQEGQIDENIQLTLNSAQANNLYHDVSQPVRDTILEYANIVGGNTGNGTAATANNALLNNTITIDSGRDVEQVARMVEFGGSTKAAMDVTARGAQALASRMGIGSSAESDTQVIKGQNGAAWAQGNYNHQRNRDFNAQGVDYGHDLDVGGVTAGMDFKVMPGVEVGGMINVGGGSISGRGAADGVENEVDYIGAGVYARAKVAPKAQVVADISYTKMDSAVETNTKIGKATADFATKTVSVGVQAQYDMNVNGLHVRPHAGLRYTNIDTEGHDIKVAGQKTASYEGSDMRVVSVPVGVTVAKQIKNGNWSIKPSLDLTVTAHAGDTDHSGTVKWAGVDNLHTNINTDVLDKVTVGATAGVEFTNGNFSAGAGLGYTGSANTNDLSVSAGMQYKF